VSNGASFCDTFVIQPAKMFVKPPPMSPPPSPSSLLELSPQIASVLAVSIIVKS
jgi:hypothetical protein